MDVAKITPRQYPKVKIPQKSIKTFLGRKNWKVKQEAEVLKLYYKAPRKSTPRHCSGLSSTPEFRPKGRCWTAYPVEASRSLITFYLNPLWGERIFFTSFGGSHHGQWVLLHRGEMIPTTNSYRAAKPMVTPRAKRGRPKTKFQGEENWSQNNKPINETANQKGRKKMPFTKARKTIERWWKIVWAKPYNP